MRKSGLAGAIGLLLVLACGSTPKVVPLAEKASSESWLQKQADRGYGKHCASLQAKHSADLEKDYYRPVTLSILTDGVGVREIAEPMLVKELQKPATVHGVVQGRGGLGKSRLAMSLEAQLCSEIPVFMVDLSELYERDRRQLNERDIMDVILERVGVGDPAFGELLLEKPWLLLMDSLDEVHLEARDRAIKGIESLRARYPNSMNSLVFVRVPVHPKVADLAFRGNNYELQPLPVLRADELLEQALGSRARDFMDFAASTRLDRTTMARSGYYGYVHLSTYRDVKVARKVAASFDFRTDNLPWNFTPSRFDLYTEYAKILAEPAARALQWKTADVISLVERMIQAKGPTPHTRSLVFEERDCLKQISANLVASAVCDTVLQSPLFRPTQTRARFKLRNQSILDRFLAAWADVQISNVGPNGCKEVERLSSLFESAEIAGFLAGAPAGQNCGPEILAALCGKGVDSVQVFELLDQGLPMNVRKKEKFKIQDTSATQAQCVREVLDGLFVSGGLP